MKRTKMILLSSSVILPLLFAVAFRVPNKKIDVTIYVGIYHDIYAGKYYVNLSNVNPPYDSYLCTGETGTCTVMVAESTLPSYDLITNMPYFTEEQEITHYDGNFYIEP